MSLDDQLEGDLRDLVRKYLAAAPGDRVGEVARVNNALPLRADVGGVTLLRPDGELISHAWDSEEPARREKDARMRLLALKAGADRYPLLAALLPERPSGASDCPECGGTGRILIAETEVTCGLCCGLGWTS